MKKTLLYLSLAALLLSACAKDPKTGASESAKRFLDAWVHVNHPDATLTPLGAYVLEETPGTGAAAGSYDENPYVRVHFTIRSLSGAVSVTTDERLSRQIGSYEPQGFYGPAIWNRKDHALPAGIEETVASLRVGGSRTVVIPGWLMGTDSQTGLPIIYDTAQEYLDNVSGGTPAIYDIRLEDVIKDLDKWETDSLARYMTATFPGVAAADSLKYGFYYQRLAAPSSEKEFAKDTTIYINYIGRRLDGVVFDTNIADTAKFYGIYSAYRTYKPAAVKWYGADGKYSDIRVTFAGSEAASEVVPGFSFALDQMRPHETGAAIFYSAWGYGEKSNGSALPAYTPLRFDLQIVDKP